MQFSEFNLNNDLIKGIEEAGYAECTEVQQATLEHTLAGKDVFVQSQTGTGKTAAFLISLFECITREDDRSSALVITPTRELAVQIAEEAKLLSLYLDFNIATIFGGTGYASQQRAIEKGVDILIGTPGRIIDMSNKKILNLHRFSYTVIDEADRMFDMGFVQDIQKILGRLPKRGARQTMLFSATLTPAVKRLAAGLMNNPEEVHIAAENITVDAINQQLYHVGSSEKMNLLLGILKKSDAQRVLIFVNMKHTAEEVAQRLIGNGLDAQYLTGDLPQRRRLRCIEQFKNNELPILVATDVAARGIHVDDLELVINYDIPMHAENYVHRIGRTARAGKSGNAIMLACETFVEFLAPVEAFIKMKIPSQVAEEELYLQDATAGKSFKRARRTSGQRSSSERRHSNRGSSHNRKPRSKQHSKGSRKGSSTPQHSDKNQLRKQAEKNTGRRHGKRIDNSRKQEHAKRPERSVKAEGKPVEKQHKKGLFSKVLSLFR